MTRMEQAKAGSISDELKRVALREGLPAEKVREGVADGTIAVVKNSLRAIEPMAIGKGVRIKVNANIGTSSSKNDINEELQKLDTAIKYGADAVMDLSTAGDLPAIRKKLLEKCSVPLGTVPFYEMASVARQKGKSILDLTADEMFEVVVDHCRQGVDFLTLHCGVNRKTVERFREVGRLAGAVSRGGTVIMEWIHRNNRDNPLYEQYDRLLDILAEYDVAVSLGDGGNAQRHRYLVRDDL